MRSIGDARRRIGRSGFGRHGLRRWRFEVASAALGAGALLVGAMLLAATPAIAHGPTVEIRASGLSPALLNLFAGTTVHFANTIAAPAGLVVLVEEAGRVRSPVLTAPGDGWHYTFDEVGRYSIRLEQRPEAKMTIVVVPKREN